MRAMGASDDAAFQGIIISLVLYDAAHAVPEETWKYIMTKSRDQNLPSFFAGLQDNPNARHFLAKKFKQNYNSVRLSPSSC